MCMHVYMCVPLWAGACAHASGILLREAQVGDAACFRNNERSLVQGLRKDLRQSIESQAMPVGACMFV